MIGGAERSRIRPVPNGSVRIASGGMVAMRRMERCAERDPRYQAALSRADRQAIVEILRDTKKDLPAYFQTVTR